MKSKMLISLHHSLHSNLSKVVPCPTYILRYNIGINGLQTLAREKNSLSENSKHITRLVQNSERIIYVWLVCKEKE